MIEMTTDDPKHYDENEFDDAWEKIKPLLINPDTGKLYDWFNGDPERVADISSDNGQLLFGGRVGPAKTIEGYLHELGHLMISRKEDIGKMAWGLRVTTFIMDSIGINMMAVNDKIQVRTEAKVWAWQYLIECACGLKKFGDPETVHEEAQWLDASSENKNVHMVHKEFNLQLENILKKHPDFVQAIRDRFATIGEILCSNEQRWNEYSYDDLETIEAAENQNATRRILLSQEPGKEHYVVELETLIDGERELYECAYDGMDIERAKRIFNHNIKINDLKPVPVMKETLSQSMKM